VIVSRGQLVEIGGGFRVPEVIAQAGARLVEVGTTNRTRRADYARAIGDATGAILRAHASNFRQLGFVQEVEIEELCELGVPVIDDVGSGVLADDLDLLRDEPPVRRSVRAGAALVCFSGDKLVGGPQAGLMVGRADAIAAARAHPLARALRLDKLGLAALEATLQLYRDPERARREIPVLAMLTADNATLRERANRLAAEIGAAAEVVEATARVGGGALPLLELPGPVVALSSPGVSADDLAARLRAADPPVIARIADDRVLLDPRTLADDELTLVARAVAS
jgi:L-seryl-tRNA(Ser) seleniumtransferase